MVWVGRGSWRIPSFSADIQTEIPFLTCTHTDAHRANTVCAKDHETSPSIYLEHAWILVMWKIWRGECSMSRKSAVCWWFSITVILLSQKLAHRMQLFLSHLTIYRIWVKTSKKCIYHRFVPKWAVPVSLQKPKDPRNRQRLLFVSGEICFFLITCHIVYNPKIQLEPCCFWIAGLLMGPFHLLLCMTELWPFLPTRSYSTCWRLLTTEDEVRVQSLHGTGQ